MNKILKKRISKRYVTISVWKQTWLTWKFEDKMKEAGRKEEKKRNDEDTVNKEKKNERNTWKRWVKKDRWVRGEKTDSKERN